MEEEKVSFSTSEKFTQICSDPYANMFSSIGSKTGTGILNVAVVKNFVTPPYLWNVLS